jgi:hypothetical protein
MPHSHSLFGYGAKVSKHIRFTHNHNPFLFFLSPHQKNKILRNFPRLVDDGGEKRTFFFIRNLTEIFAHLFILHIFPFVKVSIE